MQSLIGPINAGTTIIAAVFADGVVIGTDSCTSNGRLVVNRFTNKITRIGKRVYCARSGNAADTQYVITNVRALVKDMELKLGKRMLVSNAVAAFRTYCYEKRNTLNVSFLVAGYDRQHGPQVYSIPTGGFIRRENVGFGGGGAHFVMALVRELYDPSMCEAECVEMVRKAILGAIEIDNTTGGVVQIGILTSTTFKRKVFYNTLSGKAVDGGVDSRGDDSFDDSETLSY